MASKKSNEGCGCGTIILGFLGIGVAGGILYLIGQVFVFLGIIIQAIIDGFIKSLPFLIALIILYIIYRIVFYFTHRKPLSYERIKRLSYRVSRSKASKIYIFDKNAKGVIPQYKEDLPASGGWIDVNRQVSSFPYYIANLLMGKHHEWVIVAVVSGNTVKKMWANKGGNNESVTLGIDLDEIVRVCSENNCGTVLRLHNHPNSDPNHYTTLVASEIDKQSAKACSEYLNNYGINWFDFVCSRGEFIKFYSNYSNTFELEGYSVSDYIDKTGITPYRDYKIQREYISRQFKWLIVPVLIVMIIVFGIIGFSTTNNSDTKPSNAIETNETTEINMNELEDALNNPSADEIKAVIAKIDGITGYEFAKSNDPNHLLDEDSGATSVVFFSYDKINQDDIDGDTIIEKGTNAGGCIEVFSSKEAAKERYYHISVAKLLSGKFAMIGTVIVRTSFYLEKDEQKALLEKVEKELYNHFVLEGKNSKAKDKKTH